MGEGDTETFTVTSGCFLVGPRDAHMPGESDGETAGLALEIGKTVQAYLQDAQKPHRPCGIGLLGFFHSHFRMTRLPTQNPLPCPHQLLQRRGQQLTPMMVPLSRQASTGSAGERSTEC